LSQAGKKSSEERTTPWLDPKKLRFIRLGFAQEIKERLFG
jgi:hypothetical protein